MIPPTAKPLDAKVTDAIAKQDKARSEGENLNSLDRRQSDQAPAEKAAPVEHRKPARSPGF